VTLEPVGASLSRRVAVDSVADAPEALRSSPRHPVIVDDTIKTRPVELPGASDPVEVPIIVLTASADEESSWPPSSRGDDVLSCGQAGSRGRAARSRRARAGGGGDAIEIGPSA